MRSGGGQEMGEGGGQAGGGLTERSQTLLLINHCSVFDLSFAKGGKRGGGGGWPPLLPLPLPPSPRLLTLPKKEASRSQRRGSRSRDDQECVFAAEVQRRRHVLNEE